MINSLFIFGAKYLFIAVIAIAIYYSIKQPRAVQKKIAIFGVSVLPLSYIAAKIAGLFYYDPRPFVQTGIAPLIPHVADNGFPSDHTLICAAIAAAIYPFNKKISVLLWALTVLVGLSRVFVGVHHVVDIIGSVAISMMVGTVVYAVAKRYYWKSE